MLVVYSTTPITYSLAPPLGFCEWYTLGRLHINLQCCESIRSILYSMHLLTLIFALTHFYLWLMTWNAKTFIHPTVLRFFGVVFVYIERLRWKDFDCWFNGYSCCFCVLDLLLFSKFWQWFGCSNFSYCVLWHAVLNLKHQSSQLYTFPIYCYDFKMHTWYSECLDPHHMDFDNKKYAEGMNYYYI